ncbi:MAG: group II intron reverse transcriptase/maturase [Actinomycetota bacterium]
MPKTEQKATVGWEQTDWRKLERVVFKLQKRIYQASQREDMKAVRKLQKTLMKSWSARMLAVRRVSQENRGKLTPGVDGVKSLTPKQRLILANRLRQLNNQKAKPVRRVWIDKPGKTEKRPLGIPAMDDRAAQALVKAALEPEWEAKFEPNSFGFRPGRSCHDAIEAIYLAIHMKPKFVLDADIASCFDRINHEALLNKLNTFPTMRRLIKSWLKAGVVDWGEYANRQKGYNLTSEGVPQGGVISPLLANVALHGLENRLKQYAGSLPGRGGFGKRDLMKQLSVIRYADDFVILHPDQSIVQRCQQITAEWLKDVGLELKPEKTRLSHTLTPTEKGNVGCNFLGFTVRQFDVGKYVSKQGFKTIIAPSREAVRSHTRKIGIIINQHKSAPKRALIAKLNPMIRGWSNYQRGQCSKETFCKCDYITYQQLRGWAVRRITKRGAKRIAKEWNKFGSSNWVFSTSDRQFRLINHADTKVVRHTKVEGKKSPYDGDWVYWSARKGDFPGVKNTVARLIKEQDGKCYHCGYYFSSESLAEIHHKDKNRKNNKRDNLALVHGHCHDTLHANWDLSAKEEHTDEFSF